MKVIKNVTDGTMCVEYCLDHSHDILISHLHIPNDVRVSIATKLCSGVHIDNILDQVRDQVYQTLGCEHLINKQDIHNIQQQFSIDDVQKHSDDSKSVSAWVVELQSTEYDPVLLYKAQGLDDLSVGKSDAFAKDDFALCIQNRFQCDMLKKFGNNTVCIDSTHSTKHYNFPLTTLMVVDEFGEGIPVAFMISNHETAVVMEAFFKAIKSRVGIINPHVFMSDDASQYFSAWQKQFGESSYHTVR